MPFGPCILNLTQGNPSLSQVMQQKMRADMVAKIASRSTKDASMDFVASLPVKVGNFFPVDHSEE